MKQPEFCNLRQEIRSLLSLVRSVKIEGTFGDLNSLFEALTLAASVLCVLDFPLKCKQVKHFS